jgi:hypothetical protein
VHDVCLAGKEVGEGEARARLAVTGIGVERDGGVGVTSSVGHDVEAVVIGSWPAVSIECAAARLEAPSVDETVSVTHLVTEEPPG